MIPYDWTKLESGTISQVKFIPNPHDLRGDVMVEFNEGRRYKYKDVPQIHVEKLVHSSSPGEYFKSYIGSFYACEKI